MTSNESVFDMSRSLEGATVAAAHNNKLRKDEEATALNQVTSDIYVHIMQLCITNNVYFTDLQKDTKGDYETIEMFECAKNNTNDQCKRMSSSYFITNIDVNTTNNEMLHDTSMTDSIPLVQSQS